MKTKRILAALALLIVFVSLDVRVGGKSIILSALQLILPIAVILLGITSLPRLQHRTRAILIVVSIFFCTAMNLGQMYFREQWFESLTSSTTLGVLVALAAYQKKSAIVQKQS